MTLPLSTDPVIADHYQDLNTGCVYAYDEATDSYALEYCPPEGTTATVGPTPPASPSVGDSWIDNSVTPSVVRIWDGTQWVASGGTPGPVGPAGPAGPPGPAGSADTTPPPLLNFGIIGTPVSDADLQPDGSTVVVGRGSVGWSTAPPGLTDLSTIIVQSTREVLASDPTQPDWAKATEWRTVSADATGVLPTPVTQPSMLGGAKYWWRATSVDVSGNRQQTWSPIVTFTTVSDLDGPDRVTNIVVQPGMSLLGVSWNPVQADDFAYTEVRWRPTGSSGSWLSVQVTGTVVILAGLTNGTSYDVQARSVDLSGNTLNDDGSGNLSNALASDPTMGWSLPVVTGTPVAIPGDALAWNSVIIGNVFAGKISADWITAGTLSVGSAGKAAGIKVYDASGHLVGSWDPTGITVLDPAHPNYALLITAAGLKITDSLAGGSSYPVVSVTPQGIDAAGITFGQARGGHNLIANSSFEMGAFVASTSAPATWDVAADWNAAGSRQGADTNVTTGASTLTMTTI